MSNCSEHKKEVLGESDMKVIAAAICDLHYESLPELFEELRLKFIADGKKDYDMGHFSLNAYLNWIAADMAGAKIRAELFWQISKPFMET